MARSDFTEVCPPLARDRSQGAVLVGGEGDQVAEPGQDGEAILRVPGIVGWSGARLLGCRQKMHDDLNEEVGEGRHAREHSIIGHRGVQLRLAADRGVAAGGGGLRGSGEGVAAWSCVALACAWRRGA